MEGDRPGIEACKLHEHCERDVETTEMARKICRDESAIKWGKNNNQRLEVDDW